MKKVLFLLICAISVQGVQGANAPAVDPLTVAADAAREGTGIVIVTPPRYQSFQSCPPGRVEHASKATLSFIATACALFDVIQLLNESGDSMCGARAAAGIVFVFVCGYYFFSNFISALDPAHLKDDDFDRLVQLTYALRNSDRDDIIACPMFRQLEVRGGVVFL